MVLNFYYFTIFIIPFFRNLTTPTFLIFKNFQCNTPLFIIKSFCTSLFLRFFALYAVFNFLSSGRKSLYDCNKIY